MYKKKKKHVNTIAVPKFERKFYCSFKTWKTSDIIASHAKKLSKFNN